MAIIGFISLTSSIIFFGLNFIAFLSVQINLLASNIHFLSYKIIYDQSSIFFRSLIENMKSILSKQTTI